MAKPHSWVYRPVSRVDAMVAQAIADDLRQPTLVWPCVSAWPNVSAWTVPPEMSLTTTCKVSGIYRAWLQ